MEKRLLLFFVLSMAAVTGYTYLQSVFAPPRPEQRIAAESDDGNGNAVNNKQVQVASDDSGENESRSDEPANSLLGEQETSVEALPDVPTEVVALGSSDPDSPWKLLVLAANQGASIVHVEIISSEHRDLGTTENRQRFGHKVSGYLGPLAVTHLDTPGVQVNVVPHGTPAARAQSLTPGAESGLQKGDVIRSINDRQISDVASFHDELGNCRPEDTIHLLVQRFVEGEAEEVHFEATLEHPRLALIQSEVIFPGEELNPAAERSFLLGLLQNGGQSSTNPAQDRDIVESLLDRPWEITKRPDESEAETQAEQVVEFSLTLGPDELEKLGHKGRLRIIRRYRLAQVAPQEEGGIQARGYHLRMEIEFHNLGDSSTEVAYQLNGPAGLPTEGWWYLYKTHPKMFKSAGARDVVWGSLHGHQLVGCTDISKHAEENPSAPLTKILTTNSEELKYAGVDTQYFAVTVMPDPESEPSARPLPFASAVARPVGALNSKRLKVTNVSFQLKTKSSLIGPGETLTQEFLIFAGPKSPRVLADYGLDQLIVYGWFEPVAKLMGYLLHFFYSVTTLGFLETGSYGLAIIMLTVLVRGCMFPVGRKQAQMAAKMQELAPEIKKIAEKYKNDMEKKAKAQQELFKKHNHNPLSGCLPMVIQLPIFIGLYRALSVDIGLRGAALVPGLTWCSNLAAPDQLFYWEPWLFARLGSLTGFLGPFFNILPLFTIAFFLLHQKLFMPPATDDQTAMQQKMMKFMMIFMGVIFFRVAAGLCLYIIASSAWGVAERLLLPKPAAKTDQPSEASSRKNPASAGSNGSSNPNKKTNKKKSKGKR